MLICPPVIPLWVSDPGVNLKHQYPKIIYRLVNLAISADDHATRPSGKGYSTSIGMRTTCPSSAKTL